MQTQIVKPATARLEGAYLLLVCIAVLAVCTALILKRQTKIETLALQPYQISAFADLNKAEQGLFNDLYAAALELQTVYRDGKTWLSLDDLQDLAMPPFAASAPGAQRGRHQWSTLPFGVGGVSAMGYFGKSANVGEARTFLLLMSYRAPPQAPPGAPVDPNAGLSFSVWVNGDAAVAAPKATDSNALVDLGWKEAVALKGKDIQRIEGKTK